VIPEIARVHTDALFFICYSLTRVAYDCTGKERAGMPIASLMQNSRVLHQRKNGRAPWVPPMLKIDAPNTPVS
jgi:hypothetical protein